MSDETLAALLRRAVYEGIRDALRSVEHDQMVPMAGEGKEIEECRDQGTNYRGYSGRRGSRAGGSGALSASTRRQRIERKIDKALSTIQTKMKRTK